LAKQLSISIFNNSWKKDENSLEKGLENTRKHDILHINSGRKRCGKRQKREKEYFIR
jgi:hypothetical protein